ncbi:glycosyltransferase family 2 protein [Leucobacter sp. GX0328]
MNDPRTPRVSVIIPVYNSMPYLTGTLESVLAQDLAALEVIAVDDGSTDGSGAELDRFAALDARLTVVHQPNSGWPGSPRNRGLERASGEFVFFMDSDDTMPSQALRSMIEMVDETDDEPIDVVVPRFVGTGGRDVQSVFKTHPHGTMRLERAMETISPQKLFRREIIERDGLRFPEEKVRLEDGIFVARAYVLARRIAFCGREPLYCIARRDDGGNISSSAIDPRNYVESCRRIAGILRAGVADPARADALVHQFFLRKGLRFYAPRKWSRMSPKRRAVWIDLHREFLDDLVPVALDAHTTDPCKRRLLGLIRAGDLTGLNAFIEAGPRLAHESVCARAVEAGRGIELEVLVRAPGQGSPLVDDRPSRARLRMLRANAAAVPQLSRHGSVRRAGRALSAALSGPTPRFSLLLGGRRDGRLRTVPGTVVGYESGGAPAYRVRFSLSQGLLRTLGRQRIDLWTAVETRAGFIGERTRVGAGGTTAAASTPRVYATDAGNLSLDLRRHVDQRASSSRA